MNGQCTLQTRDKTSLSSIIIIIAILGGAKTHKNILRETLFLNLTDR